VRPAPGEFYEFYALIWNLLFPPFKKAESVGLAGFSSGNTYRFPWGYHFDKDVFDAGSRLLASSVFRPQNGQYLLNGLIKSL
jgi:hypothetical protein